MTTPTSPAPAGGQVRTCVGCRAKARRAALVRVVLVPHAHRAVVDERTDAPGRGAWLHADRACLDLAEHRRAFTRALRSAGPVDLTAVAEWFSTAEPDLARHESSTKKAGWKPMGTR
ncbi:YlxR family protein [Georgenia sp. 311]|uniref:YlxR family protein n=2 Tax=Georgenia TaxID=154116 RepID=A0ABX5VQE8_9MICO|nr:MULTISPECIES: YlxR family protein [Georgenia]QDB80687.1 YlxR family protein [Georgenia wutianyii]TNC16793.1 YlxR family protein [Georgenia sp. 311]